VPFTEKLTLVEPEEVEPIRSVVSAIVLDRVVVIGALAVLLS
jgi:hypothetical protein